MTRYAVAVGRRLGLNEAELQDLYQAALLHDIGKIAIPDSLLLKAGPLTSLEREKIKEHCQLGVKIISALVSHRVQDGILSHQERFDGKGYPWGLSGEKIPLFGRIIAVVDSFEAMTGDRPYRPPKTREQAIEEIRRCAGTQFDPRVVDAFLEVLEQGQ